MTLPLVLPLKPLLNNVWSWNAYWNGDQWITMVPYWHGTPSFSGSVPRVTMDFNVTSSTWTQWIFSMVLYPCQQPIGFQRIRMSWWERGNPVCDFFVWTYTTEGHTSEGKYYHLVTARKRSLGQGNMFTPVCHSVHRGGAWWRPSRTATAAGGTHPTGMHSCSVVVIVCCTRTMRDANSCWFRSLFQDSVNEPLEWTLKGHSHSAITPCGHLH